MYICITILAYFLTDTLNWQVLETFLKNKVFLKQMKAVENPSLPRTNKQIKGQVYISKILNSIKQSESEKF